MSEVPQDPQSNKAAIREQARKNRIAQKNKLEISQQIFHRLIAMPEYQAANTILYYVDAGSEVKTRQILPEAIQSGKRIIVPYCIVETNQLELFWLKSYDELVEGAYKILEPREDLRKIPERILQAEEMDLVLVPGTAFDPQGARMGQGKGYYDRLLANARPNAPLVGIAFQCQIFPEIPVAPHDVFMDIVLTEEQLYRGRGRS